AKGVAELPGEGREPPPVAELGERGDRALDVEGRGLVCRALSLDSNVEVSSPVQGVVPARSLRAEPEPHQGASLVALVEERAEGRLPVAFGPEDQRVALAVDEPRMERPAEGQLRLGARQLDEAGGSD